MPPKQKPIDPSSDTLSTKQTYLLIYNAVCFILWTTITLRLFLLAPLLYPSGHLHGVYDALYSPLLTATQSLALLEILHSAIGLVRAPIATTLLQVTSRLLVVWGVLYLFPTLVTGNENILGVRSYPCGRGGDVAFCGCLTAWGITEMVRYSFFCFQVSPYKVPGRLNWARYNTFFVLYPIGIASECWLIYLAAVGPASREIGGWYEWVLRAVLLFYVPGKWSFYNANGVRRWHWSSLLTGG